MIYTYVNVFGFKMAVRKGVHFADRFISEGDAYETYLRDAYTRLLARNGAFLDVGSQYGFYTLMAKQNRPNRVVYAIEPNPDNYCALVDTIRANQLQDVIPIQCYADSKFSTASWYGVNDCGVVDKQSKQKDIVGIPIDALEIGDVSCIKLDTEGCEELVLSGMRSTISRSNPGLVVEVCESNLKPYGCSVQSLFRSLTSFGYNRFSLYDYHCRKIESDSPEKLILHINENDIYGCDVACEIV